MFSAFMILVAYVAFFVWFLFNTSYFDFFTRLLICLGLAVVALIWAASRMTRIPKRRSGPAAAPATSRAPAAKSAAAPADDSGTITFRVAGTTYDNDDGSSRQEILRHLKFGDAPYAEDPDDLLVTIEETSFDGDLALAVYINSYQIGYVPKSKISQVKKALDSYAWTTDAVSIIGGGQSQEGKPLSWGCSITISY